MSRYNLIDEKWIPVIDLAGERKGLGILDVLINAEHIAAIEDPSPLVTAALHRFLLAVLYRALEGPCDIDEARKLFNDGLPKDKIKTYLDKWRDRFWLFDKTYPFGQIPGFNPKTWHAWTTLAAEHNADNAKVLFDHINVAAAGEITSAKVSLWLIATQTFALSAGKSELSHTGTAPSAGSLLVIPVGQNLLDTLLFCLIPQNQEIMLNDFPMWEREPETLDFLKKPMKVIDSKTGKEKDRAPERKATGLIDIYTWRSRSIILKETEKDGVCDVGLASGIGYQETIEDPMVGYVIRDVKDETSGEKVKRRIAMHLEDKGIWRDFDSLLPDDTDLAPKVIEHAIVLSKRHRNRVPKGVLVIGQRYYPPRPNITYWRKEFFILPNAVTGDKYIRADIRLYLQTAEDTGQTLLSAFEIFAKDILRHGDRNVEGKDVQNYIEQISAIPHFWSALESKFHKVLSSYTLEKTQEDIYHDWLIAVRNTLFDSWKLHQRSISGSDAWAIRALVKAEDIIAKKITELNKTIQILKEVS